MNKKLLAFAALALVTAGANAKVKLPHILGDNMIIQQDSEANLWGWDKPGTLVEISTSWSQQKYSAKTGKDGKWAVKVQTPKASYTPLSITFDDGEKTTLNNVLAGEVWVCAGQSNMEMPVKGFGNCPVEGYNKAVLEANQYKSVHYVKIPSVMSSKPLDDANCEWKDNKYIKAAMSGLLPMSVALIASAALLMMNRENFMDYKSIGIFAAAFLVTWKWNLHPILLICLAGVVGLLLY